MTIWKFQLIIDDHQILSVPKGSQPLHVAMQHETPCLWMMVDLDQPKENIDVLTYATGYIVDSYPKRYVGSYICHDDNLVFHVFLAKKPEGFT